MPEQLVPGGAAVENAAKGASTASIERRGSDERTAELKRAADGAPPSSPSPKRTASGAAAAAPASPGEKAVHQPERRVILTTHPLQYSSSPMAINWGAADPQRRGPVVATLHAPRSRNAMGTHNGPYAVYRAVSVRWNAARLGHATNPTPQTPQFTRRFLFYRWRRSSSTRRSRPISRTPSPPCRSARTRRGPSRDSNRS